MELTREEIDALQKILVNYYQGRVSIAAEASTIERLSNKLKQIDPKPEEVGDGSTQG
jgi:hypothetical protein